MDNPTSIDVILFVTINVIAIRYELKYRGRRKDEGSSYDADDLVDKLPTHLQRELYKDRRRKESVPRLARKSPLYDNYRMYGPDGKTLLCTTSAKKARWYVRKCLAEWWIVKEDLDDDSSSINNNSREGNSSPQNTSNSDNTAPTSIRLLFIPKNLKEGVKDENYVDDFTANGTTTKLDVANENNVQTAADDGMLRRSHKDNLCVACGTLDGLMRHYIVPHCYRRKMPTKYKSHQSHDIVLLCVPCHVLADRDGRVPFEKDLDRRYRTGNYNLRHQTHKARVPDQELRQVQSCARAILWHADRIPPAKREQCIKKVQKYSFDRKQQRLEEDGNCSDNVDGTISEELLYELANMETDRPNPYFISTPDLIVQELLMTRTSTTSMDIMNEIETQHDKSNMTGMSDTAIEDFVRAWRKIFIDTLHPQFLPKGWSVDSAVSNDDRSIAS